MAILGNQMGVIPSRHEQLKKLAAESDILPLRVLFNEELSEVIRDEDLEGVSMREVAEYHL